MWMQASDFLNLNSKDLTYWRRAYFFFYGFFALKNDNLLLPWAFFEVNYYVS